MLVLLLNLLKKIQLKLKALIQFNDTDLTFGLNRTVDLEVPKNTTVVLSAPGPGEQQQIFQYRNIIIHEGGVLTAEKNPFILQASGTITINGHLNMDGKGGKCNSDASRTDTDKESGAKHLGTWTKLSVPNGRGHGEDVTYDSFKKLLTYLKSDNKLNLEFLVAGAGGGNRHKSASKWRSTKSSHYSRGFSNGGYPESWDNLGGGGGGVLCLLYKNLSYNKPLFVYNNYSYCSDIQAIGGRYMRHVHQGWSGQHSGGGFMFVVAPNIVVGPKGRISCNADGDHDGPAAFLNLPAQWNNNTRLIYNNNSPKFEISASFFGGAGCCVGYDLGENQ